LLDTQTRIVDAVVYTHDHADHIQGLDELREINRVTGKPLDVFGPAETLELLQMRFSYAFKGIPEGAPIFRPWLVPRTVSPGVPFKVGQIDIHPFPQDHGGCTTIGYRFGDAVYSTDILDLPAGSKEIIRGAKLWIVGAYGLTPHPTHAHVQKALDWIAELKPELAVLTHMSNAVDYGALAARLPAGVVPAHDGLVLEV